MSNQRTQDYFDGVHDERRRQQTYQHNLPRFACPPGAPAPGNPPSATAPGITSRSTMYIYAIIDLKADAIIGGVQLHKHPAAAVRVFGDIASDPKTMIAKHPEDYELRVLGTITDDHRILATPEIEVVITGKAWLAAQRPADAPLPLELVKES